MHKVFADKFPFRRSVVGSDSQAQLTEEQRRDRHRSIQLHMQLLQHASGCRNQQCPSANCNKMKVHFNRLSEFNNKLIPHTESVEARSDLRDTCTGRLRYLPPYLGTVADSCASMSP